jgi:putative glutamine amidotransferase
MKVEQSSEQEREHRKPRIAIPVPTSANDQYNDRCWPQYAAAVEAVGGEPIRVPLGLTPADTANLVSGCSGILLPGSPADVHPQKYGQEARPETADPDPAREATDELLLQDAFHLRKPLLCICFGLQMMNVWRGGTLIQHLKTSHPHNPTADEAPLEHILEVQADAPLLRSFFLDREDPRINSSHHQAIDKPGDGLTIAARSKGDGTIEALEGMGPKEQFLLGVQWHPERSYQTDEPSREIFTSFIAAAHRWHLPHE